MHGWGYFSFSQSKIITIAQVQSHLKLVVNNDFQDSVLLALEKALGKAACQRN